MPSKSDNTVLSQICYLSLWIFLIPHYKIQSTQQDFKIIICLKFLIKGSNKGEQWINLQMQEKQDLQTQNHEW